MENKNLLKGKKETEQLREERKEIYIKTAEEQIG